MLSAYLGAQRGGTVPTHVFWSELFVLSLLSVSLSDVLWRRVSNNLSLCVAVAGVAFWGLHMGLSGVGSSLAGFFVCLTVLVIPYAFGVLGAADVKIFAAYGAWVGVAQVTYLALFAAIVAGAMGIVALYEPGPLAVWKMVQAVYHPADAMAQARRKGQTMPLTLAFSVSAYLVICGGMS